MFTSSSSSSLLFSYWVSSASASSSSTNSGRNSKTSRPLTCKHKMWLNKHFHKPERTQDTHRTSMEPTYCQRFSSLKISLFLLHILSCLVHLSKYLKHFEYLGEINLSDDPTSDVNLCRPFPAFSSSSKPGKFPGWCGSHYVPELHAVRM